VRGYRKASPHAQEFARFLEADLSVAQSLSAARADRSSGWPYSAGGGVGLESAPDERPRRGVVDQFRSQVTSL
jgi:hypothetical protein